MSITRTDHIQEMGTTANKNNIVYRNEPQDFPAYSPLSLKYSNNINGYQTSSLSPIIPNYLHRSPHFETAATRTINQQSADAPHTLGGIKPQANFQDSSVHQNKLLSKGRSPSITGVIPISGEYNSFESNTPNSQKLSTLKIDTSHRTNNYALSPNMHQTAPQTTMANPSKLATHKSAGFLNGSLTSKNSKAPLGIYDLPVDTKSQLFQSPQTQLNPGTYGSPLIDINKDILPNHEPTKCSSKRNGIVKAYAANTNQGIVRNYNEDRVSIILNIMKPSNRTDEGWPKCSFFGVYDGHGGVACADFLRDNLHQYVIKESTFPWNPKEAIKNGFAAAEKSFLEAAQSQPNGEIERSGSCAIVVLIVGDMCYIANVGDSRAVMSGDGGNRFYHLSRDHKPSDELEYKRITDGGGKVYQTQAPAFPGPPGINNQYILGPMRVFPGRLSVSRTFGDIEAKLEKLNGNPNVVIAEPEIKSFKILPQHDFIILASDGIYDKLSSKDAIQCVWDCINGAKSDNIHHQCGLGVESILRESINRKTVDNITVVMIAFKNFKKKLKEFTLNDVPKKVPENILRDKGNEVPLSCDDMRRSPDLVAANKKVGYYGAELISKQENINYLQRSAENIPRSVKSTDNKKLLNVHRSLDQENLYNIVQQQKKSVLLPGPNEVNNYAHLNNGTSPNAAILKGYSGGVSGISSNQTIGYTSYLPSQYGGLRPASSNKLNLIDQKLSELSSKLHQTLFKE